jgi:hypothetical protein
MLNFFTPFVPLVTNSGGRQALQGGAKAIQDWADSYRNPTNENTPVSGGWNAAVQAQKDAVKNGTQLPARGPDVPVDRGSSSSAPAAPASQEPARTSGPAPTETRTNNAGVEQKGRNLSAINMPTLSEFERYAGTSIANFAGPSFPTQADTNKITDGYNKATPVTANQALAVGAAFGGGDSKTAEAIQQGFALGGGDGDAIVNTNKPGGKFHGAPTPTEGQQDPNAVDQPTGGNESRTVSSELLQGVDAGIRADGGTPPNRAGGTLSKALADRANMRFAAPTEKGEGAKYAPPTVSSGEEMRRRSAFLDADTSLQGLRNVEGGLGYVVAGGNA